ncbi:Hpt domain-containing protein [Roseateles sp. BYS180W]|uniref:histidine kinase n=1 Tax=Roseateles rivi TaxID=3299028 RepID=A0ABW7FSE2_9BURK
MDLKREPESTLDLSPLAWVKEEVHHSLESVHKILRRALRDKRQRSALRPDDSHVQHLHTAAHQMHQAAGALAMVGQGAASRVLRAAEAELKSLAAQPERLEAAQQDDIERANFAVLSFLAKQLAGNPVHALSLFPAYRTLQQANGAERIHPADLWEHPWEWRPVAADVSARMLSAEQARSPFELTLLRQMRQPTPGQALLLSDICAGYARSLQDERACTLWMLAAAMYQSLALGLFDEDVQVKRMGSRLLAQLKAGAQAPASERLAQDLLFFCTLGQELRAEHQAFSHRIAAVREAYGLRQTLGSYEDDSLGRIDPAWVQQAKRQVQQFKDNWASVADGEMHRAAPLDACAQDLGLSLERLFPRGATLAQSLRTAVAATLTSGQPPSPTLAMELATCLLYVEATLENEAYDQAEQALRVQSLAARLDAALRRHSLDMPEPWMEDLYRRVADRQNLGSVVNELRLSLGEVERLVDEYFRRPDRTDFLEAVPALLQAMRGVFHVLALEPAVQVVQSMRQEVQALAQSQPVASQQQAAFDRLARNLGALGFLIDMLLVQPKLTTKMFRFDASSGMLQPPTVQPQQSRINEADRLRAQTQAAAAALNDAQHNPTEVAQELERLSLQARAADAPDVVAAVEQVQQQMLGHGGTELACAPSELPQSAPSAATPEHLDQDMLEVFLEEAQEVLEQAREGLARLQLQPAAEAEITTVRRAFHTLKGSSRMVGLNDFGATAWAYEQCYNDCLALAQPQVDPALLDLSTAALQALAQWVQALMQQQQPEASPEMLCQHALAWRAARRVNTAQRLAPKLHETVEMAPQAPSPSAMETLPAALADMPAQPTAALELPQLDDVVELPTITETVDERDLVGARSVAPVQAASTLEVQGLPLLLDLDLSLDPTEAAQGKADIDTSAFNLDLGEITTPAATDLAQDESVPGELAPEAMAAPDVSELMALPPEFAGLDLDLTREPAQDQNSAVLEPGSEADTETDADVEAQTEPETAAYAQVAEPRAVLSLVGGTALSAPAPLLPDEDQAPATDDAEGAKVIGPLRVPIALFNIFLNEADERSRQLITLLQEWAAVPGSDLPQGADALAHALAGSSATVGHQSLSQLARALEHALVRCADVLEPDAELLLQAAQEIRQLLHQFAAGFWREAPEVLIERLQHYPAADVPRKEPQDSVLPLSASSDISIKQPLSEDVDAELLQIFLEEARELLTELHGALRSWGHQPEHSAPGVLAMRVLHTFKGGARLAGAMGVGEQAHELESQIERLLAHGAGPSALAALQEEADALEQALQALDLGASVATAVTQAQPTRASVAETQPQPQLAPPEDGTVAAPARSEVQVDWARFDTTPAAPLVDQAPTSLLAQVRVRGAVLERMTALAGEVAVRRTRLGAELAQMRHALGDLDDNLERLRTQLRELELQAEARITARQESTHNAGKDFDPLEFDRFTRFQELTRMLAESVNDVATVQRGLRRSVSTGEDELAAQLRLTRTLQDDLLRTRMMAFESALGERLHRLVRQAARETGKQAQLLIEGGHIELDRAVLERLTGALEHLLRNSVVHGIELPQQRLSAGKPEQGEVRLRLSHSGSEVLIVCEDDGAGLDLPRIRERALAQGLIAADSAVDEQQLVDLIYTPGLTTAEALTEMAGRGVGMDVVRTELETLGGGVRARSRQGEGTRFELRVPLTTALTRVVVLRQGERRVAVPAQLMLSVQRVAVEQVAQAYTSGQIELSGHALPFYALGALLGEGSRAQLLGRHVPLVLVHSAGQQLALHVDEVLGNQEVVVKSLGEQLVRVPGLSGISVLASGEVALLYNPVLLAQRYGVRSRELMRAAPLEGQHQMQLAERPDAPPVLVVDDSLTVRRVTQRLLEREGLRVMLAKDGMEAMEVLSGSELPSVVLSDIEMPRMDGFDLVRHMRADPRLAQLPVIMITSRIAPKHREYAFQLGVVDYLGKPYDEELLLRLIGRYTTATNA